MKAVILVGGFGTRLRPFTFTKPKPLVPFANEAIVIHQINALVKAGVNHIILAVGHMPEQLKGAMADVSEKFNIKIDFSIENEPLGTAGPLILARDLLLTDDEPFFMLNSDVACEFPLTKMLNFHKSHKREGTILVTPVEDPSKYGLVLSDPLGKISEFLEKPTKSCNNFPSNKINAGIYLLNKSVLKLLPETPKSISIERQVFPAMVVKNDLYAMTLDGYWMDVGQPKDFLIGTKFHLASTAINAPEQLRKGNNIKGNVIVHESVKIGDGCSIGPDVVIGQDCVIGHGVRLSNTTIMAGSVIHDNALVTDSIVGWENKINAWSHVRKCFLGCDVEVATEIILNEVTVCPHKEVKQSIFEQTIIM